VLVLCLHLFLIISSSLGLFVKFKNTQNKTKSTLKTSLEPLATQNCKCVIVGDTCGKTALLTAAMPDCQGGSHNLTTTTGNCDVNLSCWDCKGSDEYDRLRPLSYPPTNVFVICFSLIDRGRYFDWKCVFWSMS
jgi:GTPase SAR1 family protein